MVGIPSTYPLPLVMLESMIKSLLSVIKELKHPRVLVEVSDGLREKRPDLKDSLEISSAS
jgi:hypothetical protein